MRRVRRGVRCATLALLMVGCQRLGAPAPPGPASAHPACPAPRVEVSGWALVRDSAGVAYRLPPGWVQREPGDLPYRQWTSAEDPSGRVSIGFSPSREHWISLRRAPSPGMHEMTECIDTLGDRQILLQAWRTEDGIFRDGRRSDLYEMLALVSVEPMLTLFVTGGGSDPRFQALLLAIARMVEITSPP